VAHQELQVQREVKERLEQAVHPEQAVVMELLEQVVQLVVMVQAVRVVLVLMERLEQVVHQEQAVLMELQEQAE
jgi:hypothetical protein